MSKGIILAALLLGAATGALAGDNKWTLEAGEKEITAKYKETQSGLELGVFLFRCKEWAIPAFYSKGKVAAYRISFKDRDRIYYANTHSDSAAFLDRGYVGLSSYMRFSQEDTMYLGIAETDISVGIPLKPLRPLMGSLESQCAGN